MSYVEELWNFILVLGDLSPSKEEAENRCEYSVPEWESKKREVVVKHTTTGEAKARPRKKKRKKKEWNVGYSEACEKYSRRTERTRTRLSNLHY